MAPSRRHTSRRDRLYNKQALSHQIELQANIKSLINDVRGSQCNAKNILSKLLTAQENIEGIESHFKRILEPIYYNERRASDSTTAERVLSIPELLELVLENVDFVDLLNMTRVSRTIRANMGGSPRLQKILCLKAAEPNDDILHCPFARCVKGRNGFRFNETKNKAAYTATFAFRPDRELPKIGYLWRKRFICQPPIMRLHAYMWCCALPRETSSGTAPKPVRTIDSETGITIGDLYDVVEELTVQHKDCEASSIYFDDFVLI